MFMAFIQKGIQSMLLIIFSEVNSFIGIYQIISEVKSSLTRVFNNYSSSPNGLLTQRPFGLEE